MKKSTWNRPLRFTKVRFLLMQVKNDTGPENFTRLVEYKKFTRQKYDDDTTIVGMEIPVIDGGKHYPVPFKSEIAKAQNYFDDMPDGVFSFGRAGTYRYGYDIDDCVESAIIMGKQLASLATWQSTITGPSWASMASIPASSWLSSSIRIPFQP